MSGLVRFLNDIKFEHCLFPVFRDNNFETARWFRHSFINNKNPQHSFYDLPILNQGRINLLYFTFVCNISINRDWHAEIIYIQRIYI